MPAQPLAVDYRQEAAPLQILPKMPLLSSHQSSWKTIHAHHRLPAWELPEVYSEQHIITIPTKYDTADIEYLALLNRSMKHRFYPHPSPLPKGEGTRVLAPFSLGRRVGEGFAPLREEGISYLRSAMPNIL